MGSSNGAALVNQMMIETRMPNIRNYISAVSPLNAYQFDGSNFKAKGPDNNYRQTATPMKGRRLLNISGTEDRLIRIVESLEGHSRKGRQALLHRRGRIDFPPGQSNGFHRQ